jgi:hypothetical protein
MCPHWGATFRRKISMIKRVLMAGAFAGLLTLGGAGASSALPLAKPGAQGSPVTLVGHHGGMGRGGIGHGGMGRGMGGHHGGYGAFRQRGGMNLYARPHGYGYGYGRYPRHRYYGGGFPYFAYYGGGYGYGYGYSGCGWLHRQAIVTGSPYWWQRYEACRYSY